MSLKPLVKEVLCLKHDVKPNEVIAHDDPTAICTVEGQKRWQALREKALQRDKQGEIIGVNARLAADEMLKMYGPYGFEDKRKSGRNYE